MTAAVILAAGASSRMGSPKALLNFEGEAFLARLARLFQSCCDGPVVAVLGFHADALRGAAPAGVTVVVNADPARGMLSSLQCGLAETLAADNVFFTPVDFPAIQPDTIASLKDVAGAIVIPRFKGERGHPVRISAGVRAELLALPPAARTHDVIRARVAEHVYVDIDDPGVTFDVDDPGAFALLSTLGNRS